MILLIHQEMQSFLGNISHKDHVKFQNTQKPNVLNKRFKRHVYGKPNVSLTQILKYLANIITRPVTYREQKG